MGHVRLAMVAIAVPVILGGGRSPAATPRAIVTPFRGEIGSLSAVAGAGLPPVVAPMTAMAAPNGGPG